MTKSISVSPAEPIPHQPTAQQIADQDSAQAHLTQSGGNSMVAKNPGVSNHANNNIAAARTGLAASAATGASADGHDVTMSGASKSGGRKRRRSKKRRKSKKRRRSKKRRKSKKR